MGRFTQVFMQFLAWSSSQAVAVRWLATIFLFVTAVFLRSVLGALHGANPALIFYPLLLVAAVLLGLREALFLLAVLIAIGTIFYLPAGMYLQPIGWCFTGSLTIVIIGGLKSLAEQLAAANERQRILFQEVQHRVANTLQSVVGTLEVAQKRVMSSPIGAANLMEDAAQRIAASADVHRRLHDPALFRRALGSILRDAVFTVIDHRTVNVVFDIEELDLTFDQMSTITMLVIEFANNSQKHVFQHRRGSSFSVSLRALPDKRAMLTVRDDGPGAGRTSDTETTEMRLGFRIIRGLVNQIRGTLTVTPERGTEIIVEFPTV